MNVKQITDSIYYIGVNDRTTHLFEALWPLPYGVSYNSYLVKGSEKTAIIDGVEVSHALKLIDHIHSILGDKHPDYLIINHMEPDHSGAIAILKSAYPDITIVGNTQTLNMINGFYGISTNTLCIKDGDTLSLGNETLRFALTPMVHWPETMMTIAENSRALFAGDAFGCFGALNGAVIDSDMTTDMHFREMIRYYSNIVGKYGAYVQRALAKLKGTDITTICSTHGPVWQENVTKVIDLYDKLSRYEPLDNGVTIVYGSMYGNTESLVESTASYLADSGIKDITVHNASTTHLSYILADIFTHRGLIVAAPTYSADLFPPIREVMDAIVNRQLANRTVGIIGSYTWAQQASKRITDYLQTSKLITIGPIIELKHAPSDTHRDQSRELASQMAAELKAFQ
ncbi:MAG: FprA family A-type flavoprotein [Muribaculaceae bacterium]|nr:FprA family A-type flavoprotein [Muribaculaceae bacterium]